jgi:hypothetical protein
MGKVNLVYYKVIGDLFSCNPGFPLGKADGRERKKRTKKKERKEKKKKAKGDEGIPDRLQSNLEYFLLSCNPGFPLGRAPVH